MACASVEFDRKNVKESYDICMSVVGTISFASCFDINGFCRRKMQLIDEKLIGAHNFLGPVMMADVRHYFRQVVQFVMTPSSPLPRPQVPPLAEPTTKRLSTSEH